MPKTALYTAAAVFAVVSALHWVRYALGSEITVGGSAFPRSPARSSPASSPRSWPPG